MQRSLALSILLVVGAVAAASTGVAGVAASSEYEISVVGAIDVPTETVESGGNTYEIDEIGAVEQGETITIDVTSPGSYEVPLYDTDEQIETIANDDEIETDGLEPGTYMLVLEPDEGSQEAIAPVVVQGYDLSLDYDTSVEAGSDVTFEATAEPLADLDQPDRVELAIWDGETATELTLERTDGTSYETTTSVTDLEPGTYDVYGAVLGDDTVRGYETVDAVADGPSLTVMEPDDESDETDGTAGSGDGDDSDDGDTDGDAEDASEDDGGSDANGESDTGSATDENDATDTDEDESESNVIEPNETDETDEQTGTDDDHDSVGHPTGTFAVIAIIAVLAAVTRFRRQL